MNLRALALLVATVVPAAAEPALETMRAALSERMDKWSEVMFRRDERRPPWFQATAVAIARAEDEATLEKLEACLEMRKDQKLGFIVAKPVLGCPETPPAGVPLRITIHPAPRSAALTPQQEQEALARARDAAARLQSGTRQTEGVVAAQDGGRRDLPHAHPLGAPKGRVIAQVEPPKPLIASETVEKIRDGLSTAVETVSDMYRAVTEYLDSHDPVKQKDPVRKEKQRLLSAYFAVEKLTKDPAFPASIRRLLDAQTVAQAKAVEPELRAFKEKAFAEFRAKNKGREQEAILATDWGAKLTMKDGRLLAQPGPGMDSTTWRNYLESYFPFQAELALNSKFPVIVNDRRDTQALAFRGEDYGTDVEERGAQIELERLKKLAAKMLSGEREAQAAAAKALADLERAQAGRLTSGAAAEEAAAAAEKARVDAEQALAAAAAAKKEAEEAVAAAKSNREKSAAEIAKALLRSANGIDLEILFELGKAELQAAAKPQLEQLAKALSGEDLAKLDIFIYGHTDAKGTKQYNDDLSQRRAETVKTWLMQKGVPADRLTAHGFGFSRLLPEFDKHSDKQRRVQIAVKGQGGPTKSKEELEAEAAEAQAQLEIAAAGKAQAASGRAQEAALAAQAKAQATLQALQARQAAAQAERDALAAKAKREAAEAELPAAEERRRQADAEAAAQGPKAKEAALKSEGRLYIEDNGLARYSLGSAPKKYEEALAATLTEGYKGHPEGAMTRSLFQGKNEDTGRSLAQDVAKELARIEDEKIDRSGFFSEHVLSNLSILKEEAGRFMTGRWVTLGGRRGDSPRFSVQDTLAEVPDEKKAAAPDPLPVEIITAEQLDKLYPTPERSVGPQVPAPKKTRPQPDDSQAAERASALEAQRLAEEAQAKQELLVAKEALEAQERAAQRAQKVADEAMAASRRATADAERAKGTADGLRASADEIGRQLRERRANAIRFDLFFVRGSHQITPEAVPQLVELGRALQGLKDKRFFIHGHSSLIGEEALNLPLSQRRAEEVRKFLLSNGFGLSPDRIVAQGFGTSRPRSDVARDSEKNQRVEVGILP